MLVSEVSELVIQNTFGIFQFCLPLVSVVTQSVVYLWIEIAALIHHLGLVDVGRTLFVENLLSVTDILCRWKCIRHPNCRAIVNRQVVCLVVRRRVIVRRSCAGTGSDVVCLELSLRLLTCLLVVIFPDVGLHLLISKHFSVVRLVELENPEILTCLLAVSFPVVGVHLSIGLRVVICSFDIEVYPSI